MSETEQIIRVAAKGDGVTAGGRHVRYAAPGDTVSAEGVVTPGPHHATPPCRHFGKCGGCQLQHCDDEALAGFVRDRVVNAAEGQGLVPGLVTAPHMSPPMSRRRASLRAINGGGRAVIGFNEGGSHKVVDMRECHVLRPELMAARDTLAAYFGKLKGKFSIGVELALLDQGVDCLLSGFMPEGLEQTEDLLDLCRRSGFARLSLDQGYGAEGFWEPEPVTVTLSGIPVACPPGAFLQATTDGEAALVGAAQEWLAGCANVADLFSGLGTFALALGEGRKVLAAEAERAALLACRTAGAKAGLQLEASHRDLFRNPLRAEELRAFDGIVLDPPRAGARMQVEQIAASGVERVVYISCNPSSWARDATALTEAGYELVELRPVGQFRWSIHVELASLFVKRGD
ncbi:MAG: RNA methyltransferase [Sphingomonadales bacterium 32-64-17]|nr:MAG: RNA methyltransferase [Sphingomonadales bacterium 32-64-17]